jgi:hypothetical protein
MATLTAQPTITARVTLTLDEDEARALFVLSEFGGRATAVQLSNISREFDTTRSDSHAHAIVKLLDSCRPVLSAYLKSVDDARAAFHGRTKP